MSSEIEAKLKVESLPEIERRLAELGAEFVAEQRQIDCYFDDARTSLTGTDRCLRLRRQLTDHSERTFLTYKGAKEGGQFKRRQEIEIEMTDADSIEKLLLALGYTKVLAFEKERRAWRLGRCIVALDRLPLLGSFVEIEGPDDEAIANVRARLLLASVPHTGRSYAALMEEKLHQLGRKEREVLL
jgi:adenylate cyclase class 2